MNDIETLKPDLLLATESQAHIIAVLLTSEAALSKRGNPVAFFMFGDELANGWARLIDYRMQGVLRDDGVLLEGEEYRNFCNTYIDQTIIMLFVKQWNPALQIIKGELDALSLLPFAKIVRCEPGGSAWIPCCPEGLIAFDPAAIMKSWIDAMKRRVGDSSGTP